MSFLIRVRAAWGAALLLAPEPILRALLQQHLDRPARDVARALGARELLQAALVARRPTRRQILAGAAVDATHATTMVALACLSPDRRRLALTNVATAGGFALVGVCQAKAKASGRGS